MNFNGRLNKNNQTVQPSLGIPCKFHNAIKGNVHNTWIKEMESILESLL